MNYILILEPVFSRKDIAGNVYFSFMATNPDTNQTIYGNCGSLQDATNITRITNEWHGPGTGWARDIMVMESTMYPIRQYNAMTKYWPWVGSDTKRIREYIKENLFPETKGE